MAPSTLGTSSLSIIGSASPSGVEALPISSAGSRTDESLHIPMTDRGAERLAGIVQRNADQGVTWVQSFVTDDKVTTFCIYDAPSPESVRRAAEANGLPVDSVTEVRVLDPYFYH